MDKKFPTVDYYNMGNGYQPIALDAQHQPRYKQRVRRCHHFTLLSLVLCFALYTVFRAYGSFKVPDGNVNVNESFNWTTIEPSKDLRWHKCFPDFQCARLKVPFDYENNLGETFAIAIIRRPSKYPEDDERYRGPILFNPGGPGGSGVQFLQLIYTELGIILGDEFDLVSFDPRGVGLTTPPLPVFSSKVEAGAYFAKMNIAANASHSSIGELHAQMDLFGSMAKHRSGHISEYVSTPLVAQDMLSIVKAYGQTKLQYWGFSYGTLLGATFSAMFPDYVGRVVLDGVVDADDYYAGKWFNNLRDTDKNLFELYDSCVSAGPELCDLYEKDAGLVHKRVTSILESLKNKPLAYYSPGGAAHSIVDYSNAKYILFSALYQPFIYGPLVLKALARAERGDPSLLWQISFRRAAESLIQCDCPLSGAEEQASYFIEPSIAIACGDGEPVNEGVDELREFYERLGADSFLGEVWWIHATCSGWKVRTKVPFSGSFSQNTSYPILFVGNTADPVTPVWNAHKMSNYFDKSIVLTQNSPGHCSISATSLCTMTKIRDYFQSGALPEKGTICELQGSIFGKEDKLAAYEATLSEEDAKFFRAIRSLNEKSGIPRYVL